MGQHDALQASFPLPERLLVQIHFAALAALPHKGGPFRKYRFTEEMRLQLNRFDERLNTGECQRRHRRRELVADRGLASL